jgi:hypothetical protein
VLQRLRIFYQKYSGSDFEVREADQDLLM